MKKILEVGRLLRIIKDDFKGAGNGAARTNELAGVAPGGTLPAIF